MMQKYQTLNLNILLWLIGINLQVKTLNVKIKQKGLVDKSAISGFINNADLNKKVVTLAAKAELNAEEDKVIKLKTYDLIHFLGKIFFGDDGFQNMFVYQPTFNPLDGFQNMFVYQPTFNPLELKIEKGTDYVIGWKSKGVCNFKLVGLREGFFTSYKIFNKENRNTIQ